MRGGTPYPGLVEHRPGAQDSRQQLRNLVDPTPQPGIFSHFTRLPTASDARPAAVLILFGVLDAIQSARPEGRAAVPSDLDVLLLSRAPTLRTHPGQIAFPGGRVDATDSGPIDAAIREAVEETGLDPDGIAVLGVLESVPLAHSQHDVTPVLAWWDRPSPVSVVDHAESAAVFRAPIADLVDPANRGVTRIVREGQTWRGPAFSLPHADGEHLVWGFTAVLLDGLFTALGWAEPWDHDRVFPL